MCCFDISDSKWLNDSLFNCESNQQLNQWIAVAVLKCNDFLLTKTQPKLLIKVAKM